MLRNYVKIAFKVFLRRKFFTFVSLFGISFTLAVLVAETAKIEYNFGSRYPEVNRDRTLKVFWVAARDRQFGGSYYTYAGVGVSYRFLERYVRPLETPEKICVYSLGREVFTYAGDEKVELSLKYADSAYWEVLRFHFLEGRPFTGQEDADGELVAVIGMRTRQRLFGEKDALGQFLEAAGQRWRVIGVVKDVHSGSSNDVWAPVGTAPPEIRDRSSLGGRFQALLLARSQSDIPRIKAEYQATLARVAPPDSRYEEVLSSADTAFEEKAMRDSGWESFREGYHKERLLLRFLFQWIGSGLLFISLPALNMLNLNLSRIMERSSEIGVRKAFGAPSHVLAGQFVVENVLLSLIGGLLGFPLAYWGLDWMVGGFGEFQMSFWMVIRIVAVGLLASTVFGLLSGVYPAWKMARLHPAQALRGGER